MTDKDKIEQIVSDLENGYESNPHAIEEQKIILDMKYLINLSISLLKNNEELRVNKRTTQDNNRILRLENKRHREAIDYVMTAEITHYDSVEQLLADVKYVIEKTLEGEE